ncbi:hypothetical protein KP509_03G006900 [Ceratopteris richardii]|nr:hypothetical protein KP509_03G006900 [Ceratopteris richardii]
MKQASDDGSKAGKSAHILSHGAEGPHLMQSGRSTVVEAMQTDKQPFSALVGSQIGEKQGTMTDFSALDVGSHVKKNYGSVGLKRPFSVLDIHRMTSPAPFAAVHSSGSNVWRTEPNAMGLPTSAENCEEQNRESSSVYMSGKDPMRAGVSYQQEHATATDDETMLKPPPIKVRRKHGMAMDPQSIAARTRRERFSDRIRILQNLVPNAERLDTVAMLGQTLEYVRFLQHQVWQLYHGNPPASPNSVCEKWKGFVEAEYAAIG